jgi:hypothetical protein
VISAEAWFRELAARYGLRVIGSYDPVASVMTAVNFYDGMHLRAEAIELLFRDTLQHSGAPSSH